MTAPPLTRRRTQMAVLADACRQRRPARIAALYDAAGRGAALAVRFLALEPDGILFQWPTHGTRTIAPSDAAVEVRFQQAGQVLGFRTTTCGRVEHTRGSGGTSAAWKLALPLYVEARQQRRHLRVTAEGAAVDVSCTSVTNLGHTFPARLHDVSTGGLRMRAAQCVAAWARAGEVMWICVPLPGSAGQVEFVARVLHARFSPVDGTVLLGCRFCPRDDSTSHDRQLAQLRALLVRAREKHAKGGTPCS